MVTPMATMQRNLQEAVAGAFFGSALFASGVYHPAVITSQLRFESYHMVQVMLGASATSAYTSTSSCPSTMHSHR